MHRIDGARFRTAFLPLVAVAWVVAAQGRTAAAAEDPGGAGTALPAAAAKAAL